MVRTIWANQHLLRQLVARDVASRYRGSWAGLLWSLLMPCIMLGIYLFVFGHVFVPAKGAATATNSAFVLSLFVGMLTHGLLAECLARGPAAVLSQPSYVKKVVFPIHLLPLTVVGTAVVQFLTGSGVLMVALIIWQGLTLKALLWPLAWLPLVAFAGGMTFVLAALTVYLRDLAQLTGFIATVMLFLSPVFYPLENAPAGWQQWLLLNPVTIPIEVTRSLILKDQWPNPTYWALHTVASFVALYAGWWVFQRTRRGFADVV
jgi:lipopolysaccharide transport system permease protein